MKPFLAPVKPVEPKLGEEWFPCTDLPLELAKHRAAGLRVFAMNTKRIKSCVFYSLDVG